MRSGLVALGMGAALLAAGPAAAAVPANMQQRGQLRQIIDLPALADFFPVTRLELVAADTWRLTAGRCHVDVRMVAVRWRGEGLLGPRLEPRAGRRVCRR
ncbi:MAG TPA: hypothetical protein VEC11_06160 [Allosphingosinicella sp.]|nr:hypothetical protein [Allosphingosinicella sp.]